MNMLHRKLDAFVSPSNVALPLISRYHIGLHTILCKEEDGEGEEREDKISNGFTCREEAIRWITDLEKRLHDALDDIADVERQTSITASLLSTELAAVFVWVLNCERRQSLRFLLEILKRLDSYWDLIREQAQLNYHASRVKERIRNGNQTEVNRDLSSLIQTVFPKCSDFNCEERRTRSIHDVMPHDVMAHDVIPRVTVKSSKVRLMHRPAGLYKPSLHKRVRTELEGLSLRNVSDALPEVLSELSTREGLWKRSCGTTARASTVALPKELDKEECCSAVDSETFTLEDSKRLSVEESQKQLKRREILRGREAVEYFIRCSHLGIIDSIYFSLSQSAPYRPYDVVEVDKSQITGDHVMISSYGVMRVWADGTSDLLSLADWQREAELWAAVSSMTFFKNFLIRKTFGRWREAVRYLKFQKTRERLTSRLLHCMPLYAAALLQLNRLSQELVTFDLLTVLPDGISDLSELESSLEETGQVFKKYYRYSQMTVNVTYEQIFERVRRYEELLATDQVSRFQDSYSTRVKQKAEVESSLQSSKREARYFSNFVQLSRYMISSHVTELARRAVARHLHTSTSRATQHSARQARRTKVLDIIHSGSLESGQTDELVRSTLEDFVKKFIHTIVVSSAEDVKSDSRARKSSVDRASARPDSRQSSASVNGPHSLSAERRRCTVLANQGKVVLQPNLEEILQVVGFSLPAQFQSFAASLDIEGQLRNEQVLHFGAAV